MSDEMKEWKKQLLSDRKNGYDKPVDQDAMEAYCAGYKDFLDRSKTERLCAAETVRMAEEKGYRPYVRGMEVKAGDRVYVCNRGKSVLLAHIGKKSLAEGAQIAAAHIDAPRLDLKPNPLYEDSELAYFKTHYYGGIRKYQWVTIPLELHGVVAMKDGTTVALDQQQANDVLNANGVITAINANGFKSWGNNTAAYPSTTDPKDRWWAVRRFFDWDGNNFVQTYFQNVDKPGNKRLIQSIVDSQNIIGNGYVARDYCAGYRVEFRSDENPVTNLLAGHLTVHTYLAPYIPAEYIENIREYDVDALESAIGGE